MQNNSEIILTIFYWVLIFTVGFGTGYYRARNGWRKYCGKCFTSMPESDNNRVSN